MNSNNKIDKSGTAPSPMSSDIAGIAVVDEIAATSVYPSNGDSKGTDIHQVEQGGKINKVKLSQ